MLLVQPKPLDTQQQVQDALQYAIQLEHATIPPYLTALYSLKPGTNEAIASLINGIVYQEMQHMALVANVLNAIGGHPRIDQPGFIPRYPGALPFHIGDRDGSTFEVTLQRFSLDLVRQIFLRIEEPDEPLIFPVGTRAFALNEQRYRTIGDFYRAIGKELKADWFAGDRARQVSGVVNPIYSLQDAQDAIGLIVEQGEGSTKSPLIGNNEELAHYYRFAEIWHGRTLERDGSSFSYSGPPIPFDESGVWPIIANATSALYPARSSARFESDAFNQIYSNLLRGLQTTFNGQPGHLDTSIDLMLDLKNQGIKLMSTPLADGICAAPSFEFVDGTL